MSGRRSHKGWHVDHWPPLAWLETAIKLAAIGIGVVAFAKALSGSVFWRPAMLPVWQPEPAVLTQWIILIALSVGLVIAILERFRGREVVAMVSVFLNNLGHWRMVAALASKPGPGWMQPAFAALMLMDDLVKLVFLKVHYFTVRGTPRAVLYGLTSVYVAGYLAILILEFLR